MSVPKPHGTLIGILAVVGLLSAGQTRQSVAHRPPGIIWRETFDADPPRLTHRTGDLEKTIELQTITLVDHHRVEQLRIRYGENGAPYDTWHVNGFPATPLPLGRKLNIAARLKSNVPVRVTLNIRVEGTSWTGAVSGEPSSGSGRWEIIHLEDVVGKAADAVRRHLPEGDHQKPRTLDLVGLDLASSGKQVEVFCDHITLYDATVYDPAQDIESLSSRVGQAVRARKAPTIDGRLSDDEEWGQAPALDGFFLRGAGPQSVRTEARLLYDDHTLYIAVDCQEESGAAIKGDVTERDGPVFLDDVIEVFLVPPTSEVLQEKPQRLRYFHIAVNARGTQYDEIGFEAPASWDAEWLARASVGQAGWAVEIAIPIAALGVEGVPSGVWQINICRDRKSSPREISAWSPVQRNFHEINHLGRIMFSEAAAVKMDRSMVLRDELRIALALCRENLQAARAAVAEAGNSLLSKQVREDLGRLESDATSLKKSTETSPDDQFLREYANLKDQAGDLARQTEALRFDAEIARLAVDAPSTQPSWVFTGPAVTNEHLIPAKALPRSYRLATELSIMACRGEYEPATFSVYALQDLDDVRIAVDDLRSETGGLIPGDSVDIRVVKCWYQAGRHIWEITDRILVPELLLKDDALVVVDRKVKKNFLRTSTGLVDISDPKADLSRIAPQDSKELVPFSVPARQLKQLWVTIHVPEDAAPGRYQGAVRIRSKNADEVAVPLRLDVLPFKLAESPLKYSLYYRGRLTKGSGTISSGNKSAVQYETDLWNMATHGVDHPTSYDGYGELFGEVVALRKKAGVKINPFFSLGMGVGGFVDPGAPKAEQTKALQALRNELGTVLDRVRPLGITDFYIYGIDEAKGERLEAQRNAFQAVHEVGAKVFVACAPDFIDLVGDLLDLPILVYGLDPEMAARVHAAGHQIMSYANPQVGVEEPLTYRRNYGLSLWRANYDGAMDYAYQHSFGHIWNDFDDPLYRDHVFAYPTTDGVIDTVEWEGFREGVDDVRYVATLQEQIEELNAAGKKQEAAAVRDWLNDLDLSGDLDEVRKQIIEKILALQ
jgi:hypothetical protein